MRLAWLARFRRGGQAPPAPPQPPRPARGAPGGRHRGDTARRAGEAAAAPPRSPGFPAGAPVTPVERAGPGRAAVRHRAEAALPSQAAGAPSRSAAARHVAGAGHGRRARAAGRDRPAWYEAAPGRRATAGRRDCGALEAVLHREWAEGIVPPPTVTRAVDRLAELPPAVKDRLLAGVDAIHVGPGGVPDLDDMARLRGVPLPSGRATWDACGGAYGSRKIIVGSRPSSSPDVMCHEIGHALDDIDGGDGGWQSDGAEFSDLYHRCLPFMVSDFHRQGGNLGRREFFADSFAAIASSQRPALVDMLGGDTRTALEVMLYFNLRYGI